MIFLATLWQCSVEINRFWLDEFRVLLRSTDSCWMSFLCCIGEKLVSVGLDIIFFNRSQAKLQRLKIQFARSCRLIVARVRTIPKSYCVATKNGQKSVLLRNVNPYQPKLVAVETVDPNRMRPQSQCFAWLLDIYFVLITLDHGQAHNHQLPLPADTPLNLRTNLKMGNLNFHFRLTLPLRQWSELLGFTS